MTRAFVSCTLAALCFASSATAVSAQRRAAPAVPSPTSVLGWEPGADRKLPSWKQVTDYFAAVDKASPRVSVRTLGKTTLGRPFIVAFISDSASRTCRATRRSSSS